MRKMYLILLVSLQWFTLPTYAEQNIISPQTMKFLEANRSMDAKGNTAFATARDLLSADPASGVTIQNISVATDLNLTGLYIIQYGASGTTGAGCAPAISAFGATEKVLMATLVSLPHGTTISIGKNYLYNLVSRAGIVAAALSVPNNNCFVLATTQTAISGTYNNSLQTCAGQPIDLVCNIAAETCTGSGNLLTNGVGC